MKICHILGYFPPSWGGSETHNYTLVRYLITKGYDVEVIVIRSPVSKKIVENAPPLEGIKLHEYLVEYPLQWIFDARKLISRIRKEKEIDIFDVHQLAYMPLFLTLDDTPLIFSLHSYELNCPHSRGFDGGFQCDYTFFFSKCVKCSGIVECTRWLFLKKYTIRRARYIMVKYNYLKKKLIEANIPEEKIAFIPHWLDVEEINRISNPKDRDTVKMSHPDKIILYFGRLSEGKGVSLLLRSFFEIQKKIAKLKLVYIGDGPLYEKLKELARELNIQDKVIFLGSMSRNSVLRHLSSADVIVHPSPYDNYNWALLESMCAGKPIVATNAGGTTEILKEAYNALLASPDVVSLSSQLLRVLEDSDLAAKIGRYAYETVKKKHGLRNLELYEELLRKAINS